MKKGKRIIVFYLIICIVCGLFTGLSSGGVAYAAEDTWEYISPKCDKDDHGSKIFESTRKRIPAIAYREWLSGSRQYLNKSDTNDSKISGIPGVCSYLNVVAEDRANHTQASYLLCFGSNQNDVSGLRFYESYADMDSRFWLDGADEVSIREIYPLYLGRSSYSYTSVNLNREKWSEENIEIFNYKEEGLSAVSASDIGVFDIISNIFGVGDSSSEGELFYNVWDKTTEYNSLSVNTALYLLEGVLRSTYWEVNNKIKRGIIEELELSDKYSIGGDGIYCNFCYIPFLKGPNVYLDFVVDDNLTELMALRLRGKDGSVEVYIDINSAAVDEHGTSFEQETNAQGIYELVDALDNGSIPEGYTLCDLLANAIKNTIEFTDSNRTVIARANSEIDAEGKMDALRESSGGEFSKLSNYEAWLLVIKAYYDVARKNEDGSLKSIKETVESWGFKDVTQKYESIVTPDLEAWYKDNKGTAWELTYQEYLRLNALIRNYNWATDHIDDLPVNTSGDNTADVNLVYTLNDKNSLDPDNVKKSADEAIKFFNEDTVSNIESSEHTLRIYADYVTKYYSALILGYTEGNPFEVEGMEMEGILEQCDMLKSLIPDMHSRVFGVITSPFDLPEIKSLKHIDDTKEAHEAYYKLQYLLTALYSYSCMSENGLIVAEEGKSSQHLSKPVGYYNVQIDELITFYQTDNLSDIPIDVRTQIKVYLQISKVVDFLGIEADKWSDRIYTICQYANILNNFDKGVTFNEYDMDMGEPLYHFFNVNKRQLSNHYLYGVALSSTYIPLQTNTYELSSIQTVGAGDLDFISEFHYPFGFYRKALYIDTNVNAAVDRYVTGNSNVGTLKVATLRDMLDAERDIVLYLDDNFYNINKLADMQGYIYDKVQQGSNADTGENTVTENISDWWAGLFDTNIEAIAKTGESVLYSSNAKDKVAPYGNTKKEDEISTILTSSSIEKYLTVYDVEEEDVEVDSDTEDTDGTTSTTTKTKSKNKAIYDEYTPLQSYAVTSAIYRDSSLFSILNSYLSKKEPVFVSSPNLAANVGVSRKEFNTIYNYLMLKNLEGNLGIDYKSQINLDSPIYMDIYGNILTESGLVIIPAMSNATLVSENFYLPYTTGFIDLYSNGYHLPADYGNADKYMGKGSGSDMTMKINEETNTWELTNKIIFGYQMNFVAFSSADVKALESVQSLARVILNKKGSLDFSQRAMIITEVMRGAPIENIDKDFEGLRGNSSYTTGGLYWAHILDGFANDLLDPSNGNSLLSLPNLAYVGGIEYIIVLSLKLILSIVLFLLCFTVYRDAQYGILGLKTIAKFFISIFAFCAVMYAMPKLMDLSYYQANRLLLQDDISCVAMLNLEKRYEGRELGVTSVEEPTSKTKLYLKLDTMSIPWYKAVGDILTSDALATMSEIYDEAYQKNEVSSLPGVIRKNNGLYIDIDTIFDSTSLAYVKDTEGIVNMYNNKPVASFFTPYYIILDTLVGRINNYNIANNILSYSTKVQKGGTVRTVGLIEPYFNSLEFMEHSIDMLGIYNVYGLETAYIEKFNLSKSSVDSAKDSMWYVSNTYSEEVIREKLETMNHKAKEFIANNRVLLGRISDECFLKIFALTMAVEYNELFKIPTCRDIEIYDVDVRDLLRLALADRDIVLEQSSKSLARFIYSNASTTSTLLAMFLIFLYFISGPIKTIIILALIVTTVISLVFGILMQRDLDLSAFEGFIVTVGLICGLNIIYAAMLNISLSLPSYGWTMAVSLGIQCVIQIAYLALLLLLAFTVVKDRGNLGMSTYMQAVSKLHVDRININGVQGGNNDWLASSIPPEFRGDHIYNVRKRSTSGVTAQSILLQMLEQDRRRTE